MLIKEDTNLQSIIIYLCKLIDKAILLLPTKSIQYMYGFTMNNNHGLISDDNLLNPR